MKKLLLIFLLGIIIHSGCKKEEEIPLCEQNNFGTFILENNRDYTYDLYVDGDYVSEVLPKETFRIDLPVGHRYIKLEMGLDYYYYRTVYVGQCDEVTLTHDY